MAALTVTWDKVDDLWGYEAEEGETLYSTPEIKLADDREFVAQIIYHETESAIIFIGRNGDCILRGDGIEGTLEQVMKEAEEDLMREINHPFDSDWDNDEE